MCMNHGWPICLNVPLALWISCNAGRPTEGHRSTLSAGPDAHTAAMQMQASGQQHTHWSTDNKNACLILGKSEVTVFKNNGEVC
jgi:hypothetical protein